MTRLAARDLGLRGRPHPLAYAAPDVPHLVVEPTLDCNLRCRSCYNARRDHSRSLAEVKAEIDLGLSKRRAETISILGGEPTLHPDLPAIVRYVKERGLTCQVLTNGILLRDPARPLLDELVGAGVDRIVLHADAGQGRGPRELERFTEALFDRFERARVFFGLAVTIYPETRGTLPSLLLRYARYRYFDGILATLELEGAPAPRVRTPGALGLAGEHRAMARALHVEPSSYVPSNLDAASVRWLVYFYFVNAETGRTFQVLPAVDALYRRALRAFRGRYVFAAPLRRRWFGATLALTAALQAFIAPRRTLPELVRLLSRSAGLSALRLHYVVVQAGPELDERSGALELCHHCPDATIRNGRLVPVCLADALDPLPGPARARREGDERLRRYVHEHLEEA